MRLKNLAAGRELEVELLAKDGPAIRVRLDGREFDARYFPLDDGSAIIELGGRRTHVAAARRKNSWLVAAGPAAFEFVPATRGRETG
ncbi:MAG: hypothetical protein ACREP6_07215, partial [Candidatus Binataceae bacterium]